MTGRDDLLAALNVIRRLDQGAIKVLPEDAVSGASRLQTLLIRQSASGVHGLANSVFKTVAAAASRRWRVKGPAGAGELSSRSLSEVVTGFLLHPECRRSTCRPN